MTRALRRRLSVLEHRASPSVNTSRVVMCNGESWILVGRGLLVPPMLTVEQWEATVPAQQAALIAGAGILVNS